ncbi:hypothetical protein GUJ93_ZPchr0006g42741 [Zizania palustris]|uniref:Uncharacterized protein n=1 Tax=Zizania palustris TaxID=103762 RepID=A0A8J5TAW9_ZIZPA|nr:hypothetical protein GUJ93_ZPchr0006g42741 [Zizania palustris]
MAEGEINPVGDGCTQPRVHPHLDGRRVELRYPVLTSPHAAFVGADVAAVCLPRSRLRRPPPEPVPVPKPLYRRRPPLPAVIAGAEAPAPTSPPAALCRCPLASPESKPRLKPPRCSLLSPATVGLPPPTTLCRRPPLGHHRRHRPLSGRCLLQSSDTSILHTSSIRVGVHAPIVHPIYFQLKGLHALF